MSEEPPTCSMPGASKRPTIAFRSPERESRNALCHVQCVPTISSMHGSGVTCVSWTNVSQRSMPCSSRIAGTWSSFSRTSFDSLVMAERSHRLDEVRLVIAALMRSPGDELDHGADGEHLAQPGADLVGELLGRKLV